MATTDAVKNGLEGYLSYSLNPDDTTPTWTSIGYVTGLSYDENLQDRAVYDHYLVDHYKKQRSENTGSISHLFTNSTDSVIALKNKTIGLKLDIKDDGGDVTSETLKLTNVRLRNIRWNMPETDDISLSADFQFGAAEWTTEA